MRLTLAIVTSLVIVADVAVFSAEPEPAPPAPAAASQGAFASPADRLDQTLDHLLKAADHLEAAGFADEAARIRNDARRRQVSETLLSQKEAELECLQEEVDRLRAETGQAATVLIRVVAAEVNRRKLGLKARDFDKMVGFTPGGAGSTSGATKTKDSDGVAETKSLEIASLVEANPARLPLFRELVEMGAVTVLAEPNLTTTSRRPARFLDGGLTPLRIRLPGGEISVANVWFGTQLDVVAVVLPEHRIRLTAAVELRQKQTGDLIDDDGTAHPGITSRAVSTEVEMQLGQTLAIGRLAAPRLNQQPPAGKKGKRKDPPAGAGKGDEGSDPTEFIVFVTPELLSAPYVPRKLEAIPAAATHDEEHDSLVPAIFDPADWDALGPPIPVLKRRTIRD
jgi:Flp pilus assembly secretin CpaC